jgi:hypothetical protein
MQIYWTDKQTGMSFLVFSTEEPLLLTFVSRQEHQTNINTFEGSTCLSKHHRFGVTASP